MKALLLHMRRKRKKYTIARTFEQIDIPYLDDGVQDNTPITKITPHSMNSCPISCSTVQYRCIGCSKLIHSKNNVCIFLQSLNSPYIVACPLCISKI